MSPDIIADRMLDECFPGADRYIPGEQSEAGTDIGHLKFMLQALAARDIMDEKAHRWLGWAQCLAVHHGYLTLEQCKLINKEV